MFDETIAPVLNVIHQTGGRSSIVLHSHIIAIVDEGVLGKLSRFGVRIDRSKISLPHPIIVGELIVVHQDVVSVVN